MLRCSRRSGFEPYPSFFGDVAMPPEPSYCETIGDFERVSRALEGIEVIDPGEVEKAIVGASQVPPYKKTDIHWSNHKGEIFRDPPG